MELPSLGTFWGFSFGVRCPSHRVSPVWSPELAELCGSECFIPHIFAAVLFILSPSSPWVWKTLGLTWDLFDPSPDSSCCPRCISVSNWPRRSLLEEKSGGKPVAGGLKWLWEKHPKEPLGKTSQRVWDHPILWSWQGSGLARPPHPHLDTAHTLSRDWGSILNPALSLLSELCSGCASSGSTLDLCWSSDLAGSISFCTCGWSLDPVDGSLRTPGNAESCGIL